MKILVRGNIKALGDIIYMSQPLEGYFCTNCGEQNDMDFDVVIKGDLEVESIFLNQLVEKIYCTGDVICYMMSAEEIKKRKEGKV